LFKLSGQRPEILSMKALHVLLFLSLFIGHSFVRADENELKEILLEGEEYSLEAANESNLTKENNQRQIDLYNLQKAKFKIITGDLKQAEFYLNRINDKESVIATIKKKYLATIYFIDGRFDKSLNELNDKRFETNDYFVQNCLLRLINFMAVNDVVSLNKEQAACKYYTSKFSKNDQYWLDTMIKLKQKDIAAVNKNLLVNLDDIVNDEEMSKLWLKTGLYLNREKAILSLIELLPESSYQSKKLREIIGFMYVRAGEVQKAELFIDDISTANAENIKGNINLQRKEYELAFGQFSLALRRKQDSANALERAIPLAWILKQWNDGLLMMNNISNKNLDPRNAQALKIAFLIRENRFTEAQKELILLKLAFNNTPPLEVLMMDTYVNIMMGQTSKDYDKRKLEETAEKACKLFDGMSCWIALQYTQWENLGKTIHRDELTFSDKELSVESLKERKVVEPLDEAKTIDQSDIEELDSATIKILK
jgi:hypothetical protein